MTRSERLKEGCSPRFRNHAGVSLDSALQLMIQKSENLNCFEVGESGIAAVEPLEFDTKHLGLCCGRISAFAAKSDLDAMALVQECIEQAKDIGVEHLSVRCDGKDEHHIAAFGLSGFDEIDRIVTLTRRTEDLEMFECDLLTREATVDDADAVAEIASSAFTSDRFHSDPLIASKSADALHFEWGKNSVLGKAADRVILGIDEEGRVVGFVTCRLNRETKEALGILVGTIVLVATTEHARGKGIGGKMVRHSLNWFADQGCAIVEVGTQETNLAAIKLYERIGFSISDSSVSLRKWLASGSSAIQVEDESATILV